MHNPTHHTPIPSIEYWHNKADDDRNNIFQIAYTRLYLLIFAPETIFPITGRYGRSHLQKDVFLQILNE